MLPIDDDLRLVAPGAVWSRAHATAVVADVHAGYVATLQQRGHLLPPLDDGDLHARLRAVIERTGASTLVVAGDLLHGRGALLARGGRASPLSSLLDALDGVRVVVVPGNHDAGSDDVLAANGLAVTARYTFGPHVVMHGDEDAAALRGERALAAQRGGRVMLGHFHPALTLRSTGLHAKAPAFVWAPGLVCLPALTPLARGADVLHETHGAALRALATERELATAVVVGDDVIETGVLSRVRAARSRRAG